MVCKKDVVNWFKNSKSYKRIDVMCTLLNLCVPIELRYLGTCLEHLGKRDFHDLRSSENEANNPAELSSAFDGLSLTSQHLRDKLAVYISLLHSCNYGSSAAAYKILTKTDDLSLALKSADETVLDDLLLLYTLALSHPAFSSEQKLHLEKISSQLVDEERRCSKKHGSSSSSCSATNSASQLQYAQDVEKAAVVPQLQAYHPACISLEDGHLISVATSPPMGPMQPVPHLPGEPSIGIHDGAGAIRLTYPPPSTQLILNAAGTWTMVGPPGGANPPPAPQTDSPMVSRTSSPCSRPGSPQPQPVLSPAPRSTFPPPRVPPPPATASAISNDPALRETIGKELPKYVTFLQAYSVEQLISMTDDELREIGLTPPAIGQLRSILSSKQQHAMTNGVVPQQQHIIEVVSPPGPVVQKKKDQETEVVRRYPMEGLAVYPGPQFLCHQPPHHTTCYSCYALPAAPGGRKPVPLHYMATAGPPPPHGGVLPPGHYPPGTLSNMTAFVMSEGFRSLRIGGTASCPPDDHTSSDTGSDHSPPDTPAPPQGGGGLPLSGGELPINEDRPPADERRLNSRRGGGGLPTRSRAHPSSVQGPSRGRGLNTTHRRRDMTANIANGNSSTGSNTSGSNGGEPQPVPPASYFGYMTAPYIRPPYPTYHHHPATYVRQAGPYPTAYHNGTEYVYHQYAPPPPGTPGAGPPPPPAPGAYIATPPPPAVPQYSGPPIMKQLSCYNCGSQSHHAGDCPDPTIEEVTKQGQYRLDFASTPYQKQPEVDK